MVTSGNLVISLLGDFSLAWANKPAIHFAGDRPISLFAYLLLHRHTAVSRQQLAFTLWPDSSDGQARSNLRNLLFTLRQTLAEAETFLVTDSMTLQWRSDAAYTLDVAEFETALSLAKTAVTPQETITYLETAVTLYKGDLLPGNYDDWIIPIREMIRQNYLDALYQLVTLFEGQQAYRAAARYSQRLLRQDPADEAAYVQLMRLHALSGDRAGVRRVYETCVATLRRELDVAPAPATQEAFEHLLRMETPTMAIQKPDDLAVPTAPAPRPLPTPATPFMGREQELAQLAGLLADDSCHLISIVGPGGIGKTRLALQTAVLNQARFPDGVAFASLAAVNDAIHIVSTIAESLKFTFAGPHDPQTQLFNFLQRKKMLLVLDNVEHLLSEIDVLSHLLQFASQLVLIVTSRERLNLQGEWLFPVDGLPLPVKGEAAMRYAAVRLFLHNANRLRPDFVADDEDMQAICRICTVVDGMPLALELAATWIRTLSCREIAVELEKGIDFLSASHRTVPSRHQSISAVFDYSWNLLSKEEQIFFTKVAYFRGGFSREAAQQVAGGASLQLISSLVDKSFIRPTQYGRHTIHELVRQYAANKLEAQPLLHNETAARHSAYFLQFIAQHELIICSPQQKIGLQRFSADFNNLLLAWEWAAQHQELHSLRISSWTFWYSFELRGTYQEGEDALRRAESILKASMAQQDAVSEQLAVLCARLQAHRAFFSFRCGRNNEALTALTEAIAILRQHSDEDALADALWTYGAVSWVVGQFAPAADALREAQILSLKFKRSWPIIVNRIFLGIVLHELGDYDEAYHLLSEGLAQAQELGDPRPITFGTSFLSRTAQTVGHTDEMIALLQAGLAQAVEMNDRFAIGLSCEQLGQVAMVMEQPEEAYRYFGESVALYRETGDSWSLARVLNHRGDAHKQLGALEWAEADYREALATAVASETWPFAHHALLGLAQISEKQDNFRTVAAMTTVLLQQSTAPTLQAEAEALWQAAKTKLALQEQTAVQTWMGERPLSSLASDILENRLPFS